MACQGATQEKTQRQKCGKKEAQCVGLRRDAVSLGEDEPPSMPIPVEGLTVRPRSTCDLHV